MGLWVTEKNDHVSSWRVLLPQVPGRGVGLCRSYSGGWREVVVLINSTETFLPGKAWRTGYWKRHSA